MSMPFELKPSDFESEERYIEHLRNKHNQPQTEECKRYPAGRNKTLIIKTVKTKRKPKSKNDRRLCLTSIVSNPDNITLVALKQTDKNYTLWLYPEGRRLNRDEELRLLSSLMAWRRFRAVRNSNRWALRGPKSLGKMHLSTKCLKYSDKELVNAVNFQLRRIVKKYLKFADEYIEPEESETKIK